MRDAEIGAPPPPPRQGDERGKGGNERKERTKTEHTATTPHPDICHNTHPLRSGNHFIADVTGARYMSPHPTPPNTPYPRYTSGRLCTSTPAADVRSAPHHSADPTIPAFLGPAFSTHPPNTLVVIPSTTADAEKTGRRSEWDDQSPGAEDMTPSVRDIPDVHMA